MTATELRQATAARLPEGRLRWRPLHAIDWRRAPDLTVLAVATAVLVGAIIGRGDLLVVVLVALAAVTGATILAFPWWGLFFAVILGVLNDLVAGSQVLAGIYGFLPDSVLLVSVACAFLVSHGEQRFSWRLPAGPLVLIFLAWCLVDVLNGSLMTVAMGIDGTRYLVVPFLALLLGYNTPDLKGHRSVRFMAGAFVALCLLIAVFGIYQAVLGVNAYQRLFSQLHLTVSANYVYQGFSKQVVRASAVFGTPFDFGIFLLTPLLVLLALGLARRGWRSATFLAIAAVLLAAISATLARSLYVGVAVGVVVMLLLSNRGLARLRALVAILALVVGINVLLPTLAREFVVRASYLSSSAIADHVYQQGQYAEWAYALGFARDHFLGAGPGNGVPHVMQKFGAAGGFALPDGELFALVYQVGFGGALLYVAIVARVAWQLLRTRAQPGMGLNTSLTNAALASLAASLILFAPSAAFFVEPASYMLWFLIGYVLARAVAPQVRLGLAQASVSGSPSDPGSLGTAR